MRMRCNLRTCLNGCHTLLGATAGLSSSVFSKHTSALLDKPAVAPNVKHLFMFVLLLLVTSSLAQVAHADDPGAHLFDWQQSPGLPAAVEGSFVGVTDGVMVVGGGRIVEGKDNAKGERYIDDIFVLEPEAEQWQLAGKLDEPLAFGAVVTTDLGLLCMGGSDGERLSDRVFLLQWDPQAHKVQIIESVNLPYPLAMISAARLKDTVYVAGAKQGKVGAQKTEKVFLSLDLSQIEGAKQPQWQALDPYPGTARFSPIVLAQSGCLYLVGGSRSPLIENPFRTHSLLPDAYCFDPLSKDANTWKRITDPPQPIAAAPAVTYGATSLLIFGGLVDQLSGSTPSSNEKIVVASEILAYETITDTWTARGTMSSPVAMTTAVEWQDRIEIPGGRSDAQRSTSDVLQGTPIPWQGSFRVVDYVVLAGYLLTLVGVGWYFAGREKSSGDFLLGGHRIPWWAAGLSILATQVSSIGFMAIPAKSFATDWVYFAGVLTFFMVVPIVVRFFIPFYRSLNVTTAYEYLEHRFNLIVRLYGSCAFIVLQLGRMAIVLYLPAIALSVVTGMDVYVSILVMGVLSTAYTVMGGMEAVIWTDVLQAGVLMSGAMLGVAIAILGVEGGPSNFLSIAQSDAKFHMVNWNLDVTTTAIWLVMIGSGFQRMADLTADQTVVQRYLTTRDVRQSARAAWASVVASFPWAVTVFLFGTALFAFFKSHPEKLNPALQTDAIVPWFVVEELPPGISGLVIAALFAAAMSSLDSSIHSVATTLTIDFYKRFRPNSSDRSRLRLARWLTGLLGTMGTAVAMLAATYQIESLWDLFLKFAGLAVGGLAGLFMLGIFTRRANGPGAIAGAVAGAVVMYIVQSHTRIHFFLYPPIGIGTSFLVGYVASLLIPAPAKSLAGLTVHTPAEVQ
ncbi:MAG: sodium/solute symporter [Pirellulales bacterium]|nr:sodium/solute symporter [Pirellulales bacterium]